MFDTQGGYQRSYSLEFRISVMDVNDHPPHLRNCQDLPIVTSLVSSRESNTVPCRRPCLGAPRCGGPCRAPACRRETALKLRNYVVTFGRNFIERCKLKTRPQIGRTLWKIAPKRAKFARSRFKQSKNDTVKGAVYMSCHGDSLRQVRSQTKILGHL